ncbi:MAG: heparan-alpha-glucosaminide N-acetyltransferase domain-containing protein [Bacteroidota bacterium]
MSTNQRLLSLDVFRGLTIAGMILVNNPGDWGNVYAPLLHADWHGCTPTDLVFPFFLFIVGISIALALSKRKERGDEHKAILFKILKRTLIIFGIGLFLNGFPLFNFETIRIPGVLQRIALVYGISATLFLKTNWKTQAWVGIGLLFLYWGLMTLIPTPDGYAPNLDAETNLGAWLDRTLLGGHLWSQSKVWDPEGLLSTIPAISTGISGILTGLWIRSQQENYRKLVGLFGFGVILVFLGLTWDLAFPINKKIWTSSYVLYTSGIALLTLALIYWLVDVLNYKKWTTPFVIYGTNALFVFVLSGLVAKSLYYIKWQNESGDTITLGSWIYQTFFTSVFANPMNASLAYAIFNVLFFLGLSWILYWKRIFIKV